MPNVVAVQGLPLQYQPTVNLPSRNQLDTGKCISSLQQTHRPLTHTDQLFIRATVLITITSTIQETIWNQQSQVQNPSAICKL